MYDIYVDMVLRNEKDKYVNNLVVVIPIIQITFFYNNFVVLWKREKSKSISTQTFT